MKIGKLENMPFPHIVGNHFFDESAIKYLLEWLEKDAPWKHKIASFYEQYEFSFEDVNLPSRLHEIISENFLNEVVAVIEQYFCVRLSRKIDIVAHKLNNGQKIRIHNDYLPGFETHRLLIQLNHGWSDDNGGMLFLFDEAKNLAKALRPECNTGLFFEISKKSLHAVSPVVCGDRFTLVLSFYAQDQLNK